jgi:hypothetical protein
MRLLRRRSRQPASSASPTWQDTMPAWDEGDRSSRYVYLPEIDRWRALGYDMPPDPVREAVLKRVEQMTQALGGAIDEGTGAALDGVIESWVAAWIASVETAYSDHCGVNSVHRSQASQWLTESTHKAQYERDELDRTRAAYLACRARLGGETAAPDDTDAPQLTSPTGPAEGTKEVPA